MNNAPSPIRFLVIVMRYQRFQGDHRDATQEITEASQEIAEPA